MLFKGLDSCTRGIEVEIEVGVEAGQAMVFWKIVMVMVIVI